MQSFDEKIKRFFKKLNTNAPLKNGFKYPYKPILIIAIFSHLPACDIFNQPIFLEQHIEIINEYYNLLVNNVDIYEILKSLGSKSEWLQVGFNHYVAKQVLQNICDMPATKLIDEENDFYSFDKKQKMIFFKVEDKSIDLSDLKNEILNQAFAVLKKCVPSYEKFTNTGILAYDETILDIELRYRSPQQIPEENRRQFQHIFAKQVKDRDKKCVICCEEHPSLLQAAHILPFSKCETIQEQYDENNGITLCANHHILFDRGLFTFNPDWTIKISHKLTEDDEYLKFKTFESCYLGLSKYKPISSEVKGYLKYRDRNIFIP